MILIIYFSNFLIFSFKSKLVFLIVLNIFLYLLDLLT